MLYRKQFSHLFFLGGLFVLFLFFVVYVFSQSIGDNLYPDPRNYTPNLWFDSQEEYYPANPLYFYYDKNLNELSGEVAVKTYRALSLQDKLNNFVVFYDVKDLGSELVYQYWVFYVFNDSDNDHYGDWEFVQVFINKGDKSISKVLASAHIGTTTKAIFAHGEILSPQFDRPTILVERGSHAGCIDTNGDGLFDRFTDNTNWYNSYCSLWFRDWSEEDKKNGAKVFHDSPYYKLRPLSELEEKIGDKDLISKEKSPTLGMVQLYTPFGITIPRLGITSSKFYALKLGGEPPQNAWLKPEYADPNKASPITFADAIHFVQSKVAIAFSAVKNLATSAYQQVVGSIGKIAQGFFATASSAFSQITGQNSSPQQEDRNIVPQNQSPKEAAATSSPFYDAVFSKRSPDIEVEPRGEAILWAEFRNTGTASWEKQNVSLNITSNPPSPFYHSSWLTQKRPARLDQNRVDPGGIGRFSFSIRIPDLESGSYVFRLRPVYQDSTGFHWLGSNAVEWNIAVTEAVPESTPTLSETSAEPVPSIIEIVHEPPASASEETSPVYPEPPRYYFGGGGMSSLQNETPYEAPSENDQQGDDQSEESEPEPEPEPEDNTPPDTILDSYPSELTNQTIVIFEFHSTEESSAFECLLDREEGWQICQSPYTTNGLENGEHLFRVRARDEAGNVDPTPVEFSWVIDTTAPTAFLRLGDDYSPINTDFTIVWGLESFEEEPSLGYFELEFSQDGGITWNGVELSEDETQNRERIFTVPDEERTYYIRIRTNDMLGNTSDWMELAVDINTRAVVINEIGYRGTNASFYDEWIELLNVSNHDISLAGWKLAIGKNIPRELERTIPANGFYLLERDVPSRESDHVISDIEADLLYQGAVNDGRVLMWLIEPEGRVIDRVDKIWSSNPQERISMERVSPYVAGEDPYNWLLNNGETINGQDADGNPVLGTPKAENSVYLLYHSLFLVPSISENTMFFEERGPYVVYATLTVEEGVTLTVEPGVIFHFADELSKLIVDGTLLSQGTADKEIVYTSIRDSEYGGSGSAAPGAWKWMVFTPKSTGSVFEYSRIRYPGYFITGYRSDNGGIIVSGTDLVFRNSVFERALIKGFYIISSRVTIEGSRFLDTKSAYDSAGLIIQGESEVSISGSEFRGNSYGAYIKSAKRVDISDSQFINNDNPLYAVNISPIFAGEIVFSENNYDGITISGVLEGDSRWYAGITYVVFYSIEVAEDASLTIEPGTVVKFREGSSALAVYGDILARGEEENPIIFTSLRDDEYGGDTENDGATSGVLGSWRWILVAGTGEKAVFEHVIIRYAGSYYTGFRVDNAGLWIMGRNAEIHNMVLEHNLIYGLRLSVCDCIIEDSLFRYHDSALDSTAILIDGGAPTLKNLTITNNSFGIWLKTGTPTFEDIYFKDNITATAPEGIIP